MTRTFEFTDFEGKSITIPSHRICRVSRPKGAYLGEIEIDTGAIWKFGSSDAGKAQYERAKAEFEAAQAERQEGK